MSTRYQRVRYFSLIELLVAMGLVTLLIGSLFFVYRTTSTTCAKIDALLVSPKQKLLLEERLNEVFFRISPKEDKLACFYTAEGPNQKGSSLVFVFNNEVDVDPHFSAAVLAKLYCDTEGRLILATWPHPNKWDLDPLPFRQEVLLTGVTNLSFEFFEPAFKDNDGEVAVPSVGSHHEWLSDWESLPALMAIRLLYEGEDGIESLNLCYAPQGVKKMPRYWMAKK